MRASLLRLAARIGTSARAITRSLSEIEPGVDVRWSVSLVLDPSRRSRDVVAAAEIRRVADPELAERLRAAPAAERGHALAAAGIWYDAIGFLSAELASHPGSAELHELRAKLLDGVGLDAAAAWDRRH